MNRILLVGVARSGTTWVSTILSKCEDTHFINEPDDERRFTKAAEVKRSLTRYPNIAPGDDSVVGQANVSRYAAMWRSVWDNVIGDNLLVKSVFVPFCIEWLVDRFRVNHVVWIKRDLPNVVASWYEYSHVKHPQVPKKSLLRRLAWQAAQHHTAYGRLAGQNFYTAVVDHRSLVNDAEQGFKSLAGALGLKWGHEAMEQLSDLNTAGVGGHYGLPDYSLTDHISRTAAQVDLDAWKSKVTPEGMAIIMNELERWGCA